MPSHRSLALLLMLGLCSLLRAAEPVSAPFESLNFEDALKKAATEHRLVLIDFFTTWCGPCKMLDKQTWSNPEVQAALQEKVIALKIDAEKEAELAKRYNIDAYPSMVILTPDGTLKDKYVGFMPPSAFLEHFTATLSGKTSMDLAREAVEKAGRADDDALARARYTRGQELVRAGKDEEALADFLWCYDEGMVRAKAFSGVRSSYLLGDLARLASKYPAARDALLERRERARALMLSGPEQRGATSDFASINRSMGANQENLTVFRSLPKGDPRRQLLNAYEDLLAAKDYEEALEAEPASRFLNTIDLFAQDVRGEGAAREHPEFQAYAKVECRRRILARMPALIATGNKPEATQLRDLLLKLDPSDETRQTLDTICAGLN
jgi:thiol-disulfide isomerase/thioredoxin